MIFCELRCLLIHIIRLRCQFLVYRCSHQTLFHLSKELGRIKLLKPFLALCHSKTSLSYCSIFLQFKRFGSFISSNKLKDRGQGPLISRDSPRLLTQGLSSIATVAEKPRRRSRNAETAICLKRNAYICRTLLPHTFNSLNSAALQTSAGRTGRSSALSKHDLMAPC